MTFFLISVDQIRQQFFMISIKSTAKNQSKTNHKSFKRCITNAWLNPIFHPDLLREINT